MELTSRVQGSHATRFLLLVACLALTSSAALAVGASVKLTTATQPPDALAGTNNVYATGTGFPSGTIAPGGITVSFASSCMGTPVATTAGIQVTPILGSTDRVYFNVPSTLKTGTYYVWLTDSDPAFTSSSCSKLIVTNTTKTLSACVPSSSLAVNVGSTNVDAYVPFGFWEGSTAGIERVPLEGTDTALNYVTPGAVNSCAANSATGEVVCTENSTNVDLINGAALTTIKSGSSAYAGFSGGDCENCGVAVNAANNTAVIGMGLTGGAGVQVLNLTTNTFNTAFPLVHYVSEDISIDPTRNLILSPAENGEYDVLNIGSGNALTEYSNDTGGELDSAAEDCTTGIALSSYEFSDYIYISDLTQATYTAGSPGAWGAPGQFINLSDGGYSAGTSGISSAPGTNHLGIVTGEFGGQAYSALQLPSSSGSGTPTLADYAYVATMPNTPDGNPFEAGYDPHTVTAYTSLATGKSYGVIADYEPGYPDYLAVIDLACVLAQPRTSGTHDVIGNASSCVRYVKVP